MSENRFDLLTGAACDGGLEGADGRLVPLSRPAPRHEGGLVEGGQEELELPAQLGPHLMRQYKR